MVKIIFAINQFQKMDLWKIILKKNCFAFKKITLFIE